LPMPLPSTEVARTLIEPLQPTRGPAKGQFDER
jgi:hypothetical protein